VTLTPAHTTLASRRRKKRGARKAAAKGRRRKQERSRFRRGERVMCPSCSQWMQVGSHSSPFHPPLVPVLTYSIQGKRRSNWGTLRPVGARRRGGGGDQLRQRCVPQGDLAAAAATRCGSNLSSGSRGNQTCHTCLCPYPGTCRGSDLEQLPSPSGHKHKRRSGHPSRQPSMGAV
jgi:hypothetical protein